MEDAFSVGSHSLKMQNEGRNLEFQVILLAGGTGSRMYPLTEDIPKALLPISNRPLISYQFELLERAGFPEVMVVTVKGALGDKVKSWVDEMYKGKLRIQVEQVPEDLETAEALRAVRHKIKTDFLVISGDVVAEVDLHDLVDVHRVNAAALTVLFKDVPPPPAAASSKDLRKPSKEEIGLQDFVGVDESKSRLLYMTPAADLDHHLRIRKSLLLRYPNLTIYTNFLDAHVYVLAKWTLDLLEKEKKNITSIKGEFIPYLVRHQFARNKGAGAEMGVQKEEPTLAMQMTHSALHAFNRPRGQLYSCHVHIIAPDAGFCARANTLHSYSDLNHEVAKGLLSYVPMEPTVQARDKSLYFMHPSASIDPKTQIGPECVVGGDTKMGERGSVKKSIIGRHCRIGSNVKITNSIIMDHVTVCDNCSITNSIICNNAYIQERSSLKDCQVGSSYSVVAESAFKNEALCREHD